MGSRTSPSYAKKAQKLYERKAGSVSFSPKKADLEPEVASLLDRGSANNTTKPRGLRCGAGHCLALLIVLAGLGSIVCLETLRVLQRSPSFSPPPGASQDDTPGPVFCPVPPSFGPSEEEVFGPVRRYPKFDLRVPMVRKYARLIHGYLEPWYPIKGATAGLGSTGLISPEVLGALATQPAVMSCNGQIKIAGGKVYFRYGGFWHVYYRLHRFLQTVKMIQDAVDLYGLSDLQVEMFVNTCDHPQAFYSSHWQDRSGYPIMSTGFTVDTMDIPIPDPLDLTPDYTPDLSKQIPWAKKANRAVFRGKTTNFDMFEGNWGANPRVRLHRMSDVRANKALMDCHINAWSHAPEPVQKAMQRDGLVLAPRMNFTQFNAFKFQVIVDGGGGSCRTCGVLRSNQMSFRQQTPLYQFYEPLVEDSVHWLTVRRTFDDLPDKIRWCQENDAAVLRVVEAANEFANFACTLRGRTLYWALMLVKYQDALMDLAEIEEPESVCTDKPTLESPQDEKLPASVRCDDPDRDLKQTASCGWFCASGQIPDDRFVWLRADKHLKEYAGVGPP